MKLYPHPPLYYLLSAPFYFLGQKTSPLVQLYLLRVFSVLLQCATVWLTYNLAGLIFKVKDRPWLALFPAALIPLLPQYTFISASYNNDNLVPPLAAAALFFLVRGYQRKANPGQFALAFLFGLLALTAKRTAIGIVPVLGLGLLGYAWKWMRSKNPWARLSGGGIWVGSAIALLVLLAFLRQPPTLPAGLARLMRMNPNTLVQLSETFSLETLRGVDWRFFITFGLESFWGWFGWLTLPMPEIVIDTLMLLTAVLTLGILVALGRQLRTENRDELRVTGFGALLLFCGVLFTLLAMAVQYSLSPQAYPPQGRYLFPFLPALVILGVWSWLSFWPRRFQPLSVIIACVLIALYDLYCWAYVLLPGWYS